MRHRTRYAAPTAAAALTAVFCLAGCGGGEAADHGADQGADQGADHPTGQSSDGSSDGSSEPELIASWSEADDRAVELPAPEQLPDGPVGTEAELEDLVTVLPPAEEVQDVDLDHHLLVVGTYQDCARDGRIVGTGEEARFESFVVPEQKDVRCVWAPYTIEVWQVPRTDEEEN